jgi:Tol biopolymer transport system component
VRTGIEIVTLDFAATTPVLAVVPTTDSASSVAVGATGDTIYFTRNGDSRVYRHAFSSGQTDTVFDFGGAGIARDVTYANERVVAVVGGDVSYVVDSILGGAQVDRGGMLYVVTLAGGTATVFGDASFRFRRPAFAPGGARVVAERWTNGSADLWLVDVP